MMEDMRQKGVRLNAPGYHETPLLSIGKQVRVLRTTPERAQRAMIECVDGEGGSADVVFCRPGGGLGEAAAVRDGEEDEGDQEEEATVPAASIRALEEFELRSESSLREMFATDLHGTAAQVKTEANALFKLKDYDAAAEHYTQAIGELRRFRPPSPDRAELAPSGPTANGSVRTAAENTALGRVCCRRRAPDTLGGTGFESVAGCWVLVNQAGSLVLGKATNFGAGSEKADVVLCKPEAGRQPFVNGVPWRALIPVHEGCLLLHTSLYMNRARCLAQVGRSQQAAQDLSIVIALWAVRREGAAPSGEARSDEASDAMEAAEQTKQLITAHYLRAKTRLSRLKFEQARADLQAAWALNPPEATANLLRQLEREIEVGKKEQTQSNKRIAKEFSKWADKAMTNMDPAALAAVEQAMPE